MKRDVFILYFFHKPPETLEKATLPVNEHAPETFISDTTGSTSARRERYSGI